MASGTVSIKVSDEVWIATALLHHEDPEETAFTVGEIVARVMKENIHGTLRPGVRVHVVLHCVANVPPNPARYRMLVATVRARGRFARRLFRKGDPYDPAREGGKIVPKREEIPTRYHYLLDWYSSEYAIRSQSTDSRGSILGLRGLGKEIWADEDPDSYVRRVREGWE